MKFLGLGWGAAVIAVALVAAGFLALNSMNDGSVPDGFARGNGRIEAVEINVAARDGGRIETVHVREGEFVEPGQQLAQLDTRQLQAALAQADAELSRATIAAENARLLVRQREAEEQAAAATLQQREATYDAAQRQYERIR